MRNKKGISLIVLVITILVMLILASAIIISLANNGIISKARRAVDNMNKAEITQMAELIKGEFLADAVTDRNIAKSIQEFRQRLVETFELTEDTNNDNILEVNDKYAIVIKNTDLDIEVVEITNELRVGSLVGMTYVTTLVEEDGEKHMTNVNFTLATTMDIDTFINIKSSEEVSNIQKEEKVLENLSEAYGETFVTIDEYIVYDIVMNGYGEFTTVEECLADELVQQDYGTTREQLYYTFCKYEYSTGNEYTMEQFLNYWYYQSEYYKYTTQLNMYVKSKGNETLEKSRIYVFDRQTTITIPVYTSGEYIFTLRTNDGEDVISETITINNMERTNPYFPTEEEAKDVWVTDGKGTITAYKGSATEVKVPLKIGTEKITTIGERVFYNNKNITSIKMLAGIKNIGISSFNGCDNLVSVSIPDTVKSIGSYTFYGCKSLKNINIPEGVKELNHSVFAGCSSLENITIPESVTLIDLYAFDGCSKLDNVKIPQGIIELEESAFRDCTSLTNMVIPDGFTYIPDHLFDGCSNLVSVTIPDSVTDLGRYTFRDCSNLKSIKIPDGVKYIGAFTFNDCSSLVNIDIPEGVETIEWYAFLGCNNLTTLTIPASVTSIGENAFRSCDKLTTIHFEGTIPTENRPWGASEDIITPK